MIQKTSECFEFHSKTARDLVLGSYNTVVANRKAIEAIESTNEAFAFFPHLAQFDEK
jgi:hypothetical protein